MSGALCSAAVRAHGLGPLGFPLRVVDTESLRVAVCSPLHSARRKRANRPVRVRQGCQIRHGEFDSFLSRGARGRATYVTRCCASPRVPQAGRLLLRRFVCDRMDVPWSEIRLERSPRGKPYLAAPLEENSVSFKCLGDSTLRQHKLPDCASSQ